MFAHKNLSKIDKHYFNVIVLDEKDISIQSKNTGHYWYLHCTEYPQEESLVLYHKHKYPQPYHQHGRANNLNQAIKNIKKHDDWQINCKKRNLKNEAFL